MTSSSSSSAEYILSPISVFTASAGVSSPEDEEELLSEEDELSAAALLPPMLKKAFLRGPMPINIVSRALDQNFLKLQRRKLKSAVAILFMLIQCPGRPLSFTKSTATKS